MGVIPKQNNFLQLPPFDIQGNPRTWTNFTLKSTELINYPILWFKNKLLDLGSTILYEGTGAAGQNKTVKVPRVILTAGGIDITSLLVGALQPQLDLYGVILATVPTEPLGSLTAGLLAYPPDFDSPADPAQYSGGQVLLFNAQTVTVSTDGTLGGLIDPEYGSAHSPHNFSFIQTVDRYTADCNTFRNTIHRVPVIHGVFTSYDPGSAFDADKAALIAALDRYAKYKQYYILIPDDPVDLTYDDHIKECVDNFGTIVDSQVIHSTVFINTSTLFTSYQDILTSLFASLDSRIILDWGFSTDVVAATKDFFGWM